MNIRLNVSLLRRPPRLHDFRADLFGRVADICEINGGLRFTDGQGRAAIFGG